MRKDAVISMAEPAHDQIAALAYRYWELEGRPQNRGMEHWLLARAALHAEQQRLAHRARRSSRARKTATGAHRPASSASHRNRKLVLV